MRAPLLLLVALALTGCQSLGRGIAEAVLEATGRSSEDTRKCEVVGPPFTGLEGRLAVQDGLPPVGSEPDRRELKVLFIHGIGTHLPGHGAALADNLGRALGLEVRAPRAKRIVIEDPSGHGSEIGEVNITRMVDARRQRVLDFHELTWSAINQPAKQAMGFDQNSYFTTRRASINQTMRAFVNDIAPDPIAFAGVNRQKILSAVGQTLCWAVSRRWDELPLETRDTLCGPDLPGFGERIGRDDLAFITHSLGSRATLDALQRLVTLPAILERPQARRMVAAFRQTELPVFMLSNQLPLLEAGVDPQELVGQGARFCAPGAPEAERRFFARTDLVAISDPNDLMSYPVPAEWVDTHVEARICPRPINVFINVAPVSSLLGLGELANPLAAHTGYDTDERVAALIARGAGHPGAAPLVKERCSFREVDEALAR
jgi:hypothetical protein